MSINSKAKRDARNKKRPKLGAARAAPVLRPHAEILDGEGNIVGGAGLRSGEWVMVMNGREVAATDSPAMILAMLTHAATTREEAGLQVELRYSTELRDAATVEAASEGKTLEQYLAMLEAERVERSEVRKSEALDVPNA
ncbi:MAG: hypothetical protein NT117_05150 [Gammaproteobacteria bacterium]|nr:hypothetical protein [Gammaproteobacteria bacterium]